MVNSVLLSQLDKINSGLARPKNYPFSKIKKVGVIGAGLMGHGIAYVSSYNGLEVVLLDKSKELGFNLIGFSLDGPTPISNSLLAILVSNFKNIN